VEGGVERGVKGGVDSGVSGGVEGGVEGGVDGGDEGGVEGGVDGGVNGVAAAPPTVTVSSVSAPVPAASPGEQLGDPTVSALLDTTKRSGSSVPDPSVSALSELALGDRLRLVLVCASPLGCYQVQYV